MAADDELQKKLDHAAAAIRDNRDQLERLLDRLKSRPCCAQCGQHWADETERWRAYLDVDNSVVLICPGCAEEGFGGGPS